jgi:two-component system, OmpR family, sensor histidine kinase VicK
MVSIQRLRYSMTSKPDRSPKRKSATKPVKEPPRAELPRERQRAEIFAEVTFKIRQSLQLKEILRTTVTEVQRVLQADRVLIYQVLPDGTGKPNQTQKQEQLYQELRLLKL